MKKTRGQIHRLRGNMDDLTYFPVRLIPLKEGKKPI
jgi:hypothetical protein